MPTARLGQWVIGISSTLPLTARGHNSRIRTQVETHANEDSAEGLLPVDDVRLALLRSAARRQPIIGARPIIDKASGVNKCTDAGGKINNTSDSSRLPLPGDVGRALESDGTIAW